MPVGRFRTSTPPDDELIKLGEDLVQWAEEDTDEIRCRFAPWYTHKGITEKIWLTMLEHEIFLGYYDRAKAALARRYLNGDVNSSISHRFIRYYCPEVKRDENEKIRFEAMVQKEMNTPTIDENIAKQQDSLMKQIEDLQNALRMSRSKQSSDK